MITKETARDIWAAYNSIDAANEMLQHLALKIKEDQERLSRPDAFSRDSEPRPMRRALEMSVPMFENNSSRIYGVDPEMGAKVIEKHISDKRADLERLRVVVLAEMAEAKAKKKNPAKHQ